MIQSNNLLVSVLVASYNNAQYILESLDSVRAQTYDNIELIIIDDCSDDASVEVINEWIVRTGYPCIFIRNDQNKGVCYVSNLFLKTARGIYFSWLASDDILLPAKLAMQVGCFKALPSDYAVVFSDVYLIDNEGKQEVLTLFEKSGVNIEELMSGDVFVALLKFCFIPAPGVLLKTNLVKSIGGYDENLTYEDWDMWLRITRKYKIFYSDFVGTKYRVISTSLSKNPSVKAYESTIQLLTKQFGYSVEGDEIINNHINEKAEVIYKNGGVLAAKWLKQRWQNQHSPTAAVLYIMAVLHLPYSAFERMRKLLKA